MVPKAEAVALVSEEQAEMEVAMVAKAVKAAVLVWAELVMDLPLRKTCSRPLCCTQLPSDLLCPMRCTCCTLSSRASAPGRSRP